MRVYVWKVGYFSYTRGKYGWFVRLCVAILFHVAVVLIFFFVFTKHLPHSFLSPIGLMSVHYNDWSRYIYYIHTTDGAMIYSYNSVAVSYWSITNYIITNYVTQNA